MGEETAGTRDVIVVGGGPAGLATAIAAAMAGVDVLVLERRALPADKACGEGILPAGVRALEALGVLPHVAAEACSRIEAIRWIDGPASAEARLPAPGGLGVRRTALSAALVERARALGVEVREGVKVAGHARRADRVDISTSRGPERARLLVAADGLASPIRAREGLALRPSPARRFGLRRHVAVAPWTTAVEVHFGEGVEAYVTPVGRSVGVAMLCEEGARAPFPALLARFPALAARLGDRPYESAAAGAGPFPSASGARCLDRLVLVGDAAGYVDAITGEGLSLSFASALALGAILPEVLASDASRRALAGWERDERARYRRYAAIARTVLALARRHTARRRVLHFLGGHRRIFDGLVGLSVG